MFKKLLTCHTTGTITNPENNLVRKTHEQNDNLVRKRTVLLYY